MTLAWASASAAPALRDVDVSGTAAIASVVHNHGTGLCIHVHITPPPTRLFCASRLEAFCFLFVNHKCNLELCPVVTMYDSSVHICLHNFCVRFQPNGL